MGTVDYVAPESILGLTNGDDASVDWVRALLAKVESQASDCVTDPTPWRSAQWALGVVMYEFLYGVPPFNDESAEKVFANITSRRIFFPPDDDEMQTSPEARDLMERLMCLDARRRLGAHGTDEIKRHPFFAGLDWERLMTEPGPFVPQPTEEVSTDYFDARGLTDLPDELNPTLASVNPSAATADDPVIAALADDFGGFNFRNLSASKAANDEVLTKISALRLLCSILRLHLRQELRFSSFAPAEQEAETQLAMSEPTSAVLRHDRRKSSSATRMRSRGPAWVDAKVRAFSSIGLTPSLTTVSSAPSGRARSATPLRPQPRPLRARPIQ